MSMQRFTIRQLEYFVAAAKSGNITVAAQALHISQPAITNAIAHLEETLNQRLFHRVHASGVILTSAGRDAFDQACNLLSLADDLASLGGAANDESRGTVRLGCFEPLACYYLPKLLATLASRLPQVRVEFTLLNQTELGHALRTGQVDLALSYDSGFWEDLTRFILFRVVPHAILPTSHRLAAHERVPLRDLCEEPFILIDLPESREYQLSVMRAYGVTPKVRYYCGNLEVLRGLVAHGLGVSLAVTRPLGDRCYDGQEIAYRPLADDVRPQDVVLAHAASARLTRAAQSVLQSIVEHMKGARS